MSDISTLKASVLEQAHREGALRLAEAKEKLECEQDQRKQQLLAQKASEAQSQIKDMRQTFQIEAQQIRNQERQSTLVSKQKILSELFLAAKDDMEAWSAQEELAFLRVILSKYLGQTIVLSLGQLTANKLTDTDLSQIKAAFPDVTISGEAIAGEAGFVISDGSVDDTYLYSNLIDSVNKEESSRIANRLFSES